jgi:hypothetical protein
MTEQLSLHDEAGWAHDERGGLLEGLVEPERTQTLARYTLLQAMGYGFTEKKNVQIARNEMKGYAFWGAIHKTWGGLYGNGDGISLADLETEAMILDVYDDVFAYRGDIGV